MDAALGEPLHGERAEVLDVIGDDGPVLAAGDLEQTRQVVQARRLLVAVRLLPDSNDIPHPFAAAPTAPAAALVSRCQETSRAATLNAESVGNIAIQARSRSRALAVAMEAVRTRSEPGVGDAPVNRTGVRVHANTWDARKRPLLQLSGLAPAIGYSNGEVLPMGMTWRANGLAEAKKLSDDALSELDLVRALIKLASKSSASEEDRLAAVLSTEMQGRWDAFALAKGSGFRHA